MEAIRVLLVEHEGSARKAIAEYLRNQTDILLVDTARDGVEALRHLSKDIPDVLITELVLPQLDGLGLLERLSTFERKPRTIVLSNFQSDMVIQQTVELGASYYMCKPCDYHLLHKRMRQCYCFAENPQQETGSEAYGAEEALEKQGISPVLRGYAFLLSAIRVANDNDGEQLRVTKDIYPSVARLHNTSPENVEHAIRHAINAGWEKRHETKAPIFQGAKKPSNGEYIARMARYCKN